MSGDECDHTGIVESFDGSTVTCIEGNTVPAGESGDDWNGGAVARRTRPRSQVVGYGLPDAAPSTSRQRKGRNMIAETATGNGYWTATYDGAIYCFGDAQFAGAANDPDAGGPGQPHLLPGQEIVGIAGHGTDGYWLLTSDGSVFSYGSAPFLGRPDRV